MIVRKSALFLGPALILGACQQKKSTSPAEGHIEVSWTGKDHGGLSGRATAQWCGLRKMLAIQAVRGDTGVALAVYPARTLVPGIYAVMDPARAESLPPAAAVAVRWLGSTVVQGFRGDSGRVVLERSPSGLFSGRINTRARSVVDTQRIEISGTFRDLAMATDSLGCRPDSTRKNSVRADTNAAPTDVDDDMGDPDAESPDTGVH